MDARERWQALQTNLNIARASVEAGDRARALRAVEAALAIDPEFLAAQSLRDRIIAWRDAPAPTPAAAPLATSLPRAGRPPLVSTEGYARFEERAKRRRVDKRIEAARSAIERKKLREAASALDEVIELDPNLPELASLTAAFDDLRRSTIQSRPSRGPWLAAAAVFGVTILGASWIQESRVLQSRQVASVAPLVASQAPAPMPAQPPEAPDQPIGTSGDDGPEPAAPPTSAQPFERSAVAAHEPAPAPVVPPPAPARTPTPLVQPMAAPPSGPPPAPIPEANLSAPIARAVPVPPPPAPRMALEETASPSVVPATPVTPLNDDELLVKQVLQRYRVAYEGLDAQSAQDVWPAVNQVALAHAFEGLESQRLTFDECNIELQGSHARATCRGTARYVPKIGSRQPRIEPRIWSFALRKISGNWKIDNARAER